ncbi:hypothetical protein ZHAS_00006461 [Anopheles sinensis]|uniref:Uncharacterized protein n=1 Tax=Anopheles sinensis TaxID=74873 RepID=A0A084VMD7_ANOSI|nr:hypothetical protein ZHAS_00006461 [Anopheles sinensis]
MLRYALWGRLGKAILHALRSPAVIAGRYKRNRAISGKYRSTVICARNSTSNLFLLPKRYDRCCNNFSIYPHGHYEGGEGFLVMVMAFGEMNDQSTSQECGVIRNGLPNRRHFICAEILIHHE